MSERACFNCGQPITAGEDYTISHNGRAAHVNADFCVASLRADRDRLAGELGRAEWQRDAAIALIEEAYKEGWVDCPSVFGDVGADWKRSAAKHALDVLLANDPECTP